MLSHKSNAPRWTSALATLSAHVLHRRHAESTIAHCFCYSTAIGNARVWLSDAAGCLGHLNLVLDEPRGRNLIQARQLPLDSDTSTSPRGVTTSQMMCFWNANIFYTTRSNLRTGSTQLPTVLHLAGHRFHRPISWCYSPDARLQSAPRSVLRNFSTDVQYLLGSSDHQSDFRKKPAAWSRFQ